MGDTSSPPPTDRVELVTEYLVLPAGCPVDHEDADTFGVRVVWRGARNGAGTMGGYAVERTGSHLTRAGNWLYAPRPFQFHLCRWASFEEALDAARAVVDKVTVNGRTFASWEEYRAEHSGAQRGNTPSG